MSSVTTSQLLTETSSGIATLTLNRPEKRNALSRDPGVEVACLLFHPGLSKVGGGNKDYIKQFPAGLEELSKFDVVFLGDVGREICDERLVGHGNRIVGRRQALMRGEAAAQEKRGGYRKQCAQSKGCRRLAS